ncbi:MAG: hypothetical protein KJ676_11150 [Alphaproteobacteria bacterium]|nr:hypothetical protein [Alphaproteobacteria bacterium]MBU1525560.1 hypothetical protein [Alphaproteobacteria bacterium]MBU2350495.1 hypothetical protein [Alphaproteobacteria bacterium]MBU2381512.1 hypothetical protein [Alphaproteobacteria bacterium]
MSPAYHIPLGNAEKRCIGEICALQGQIEWLMQVTVLKVLGISAELAREVTGSTNVNANTLIWAKAVEEKHPDPECRRWAAFVCSEIADISKGRNDFVHAVYAVKQAGGGMLMVFSKDRHQFKAFPGVAIRVKNRKETETAELFAVRDRAARLTFILAHVHWLSHAKNAQARSPWQRKLAKLRPLLEEFEERKRAKERRRQPRPSQE